MSFCPLNDYCIVLYCTDARKGTLSRYWSMTSDAEVHIYIFHFPAHRKMQHTVSIYSAITTTSWTVNSPVAAGFAALQASPPDGDSCCSSVSNRNTVDITASSPLPLQLYTGRIRQRPCIRKQRADKPFEAALWWMTAIYWFDFPTTPLLSDALDEGDPLELSGSYLVWEN